MPRGAGIFRRVVAGLLALVLLALPGAAIRHASAAALTQQQAAEQCVAHADASTLAQAASLHAHTVILVEESGQPCDRSEGEHGMPCCVASQCAFAVGALPPDEAGALPPPGAVLRYVPAAHGRLGIEIPPSLPPPRSVA